MPKETLKEKIERLESELAKKDQIIAEQRKNIEQLTEKINTMLDKADDEFSNSPYKKHLENELDTYKHYKDLYDVMSQKKAKEHDDNVELKKEIQKLKDEITKIDAEKVKAWDEVYSLQIQNGSLSIKIKELESKDIQDYQGKIHKLNSEKAELYKEIKQLSLKKDVYIHNARGAGRKPVITYREKNQIKVDRKSGMTIKQLSEKYHYSVGAIHKIISEIPKNN